MAPRSCAPLCAIARWNRPFAAGIAISVVTLLPPPDWPNTVTLAGIAAEGRDVVPHPRQREDDVLHADVAGIGPLLATAEIREVEEAEQVEAVRNRDDDDVLLAREVGAVVEQPVAGAAGEAAAVQPHHHGSIAAAERRA